MSCSKTILSPRALIPRRFALVGLLLLVTLTTNAHADEPLIVSDPIRRIALPELNPILDLVLTPDGSRAYVVIVPDAVNLTAFAVYYWPEVLAILGAIWALFALAIVYKRKLHPQVVGMRCCPTCGYCIEGCPTDRCPECGNPRAGARAVIGRTRWQRTGVPLTSIVLYWGAYAAMHVCCMPRTGWLVESYTCYSTRLAEWNAQGGVKIPKQFLNTICQVVALDLRSGEIVDRLLTFPSNTLGIWLTDVSITLHRDVLFVTMRHYLRQKPELIAWDICNNREILRWNTGADDRPSRDLIQILGCDKHGRHAYCVFADPEDWRVELGAWDLSNNTQTAIAERTCAKTEVGDGFSYLCNDFIYLPGECARFLEIRGGYREKLPLDLAVINIAFPNAEPRLFRESVRFEAMPLVDPPGAYLYLAERFTDEIPNLGSECLALEPHRVTAITKWNLDTLSCELVFESLPFHRESLQLAYNARHDRLVASDQYPRKSDFGCPPTEVYVGDCQTGRWIQRLICPPGIPIQRVTTAYDSDLVVIQAKTGTGTTKGPDHELLIYEIR